MMDYYSCGLSTTTIEYSCPSVCVSVCLQLCLFLKTFSSYFWGPSHTVDNLFLGGGGGGGVGERPPTPLPATLQLWNIAAGWTLIPVQSFIRH